MRKTILLLLACCGIAVYAQNFPVSKPNIGNPSLVVCHQNAYNYFVVDLTGTRQSYSDEAGLQAKTQKMVNSLRYIDADIYALCELEVNDSCLGYLTAAMNTAAGQPIYGYIRNNLTADNTAIMSGFVYRKDKVRPIGSTIACSTQPYYKRTMRTQLWEEISSGERFYLSQNHFKAKDSTEDAGEAKREKNAGDLISALSRLSSDPDILITGDLNETTTESAVSSIVSAGYSEQLERFNTNPYSYRYSGQNQLIDHALANASMATQVTGAGVFHVNTYGGKNSYWGYSDHDPIMVGLTLGQNAPEPCIGVDEMYDFTMGLGDFINFTTQGTANWYSSQYGAQISAYNKEDGAHTAWLVSPEYDLSGMDYAMITLNHNIYYNNAGGTLYEQLQTLWCTTSYTGDPSTTNWTQVVIPNYAVKSWVNTICTVPSSALASGFHYALRYDATAPAAGNTWEVKTAKLEAHCTSSALPSVREEREPAARKVLYEGQIYIIRGEEVYTASGWRVK